MSAASKKRYIANKLDTEYYNLKDDDTIGVVRASRGNNLLEVEDEHGDVYLTSMPSKFRKSVWVKRGQFVVLRSIEEGDRVKAEIEHVLDEDNVLYIRELKKWPARFEDMAVQMTREAKRGIEEKSDNGWIDQDMLPSSGSDEDEDEDEENTEEEHGSNEEEESEDESENVSSQFNPNRARIPETM